MANIICQLGNIQSHENSAKFTKAFSEHCSHCLFGMSSLYINAPVY